MLEQGAFINSVKITDDFDLEKLRISGQCFRIKLLANGVYRFIKGSHVLDMKLSTPGVYDISCRDEEFADIWHDYFDLDRNYEEIRREIDPSDTYLGAAAESGRGIRILKQDPWECLISFIISQRKNIPAITAAVESVCRSGGSRIGDTGEYEFPDAERMRTFSDEQWKAFKLGYREKYIRRAVMEAPDMYSLYVLSDEELMEQLTAMYGVGIKVASCTALFAYSRVDLAPVDVWIKRVFDEQYGGEDVLSGRKNAGILQQYLFYHARVSK